ESGTRHSSAPRGRGDVYKIQGLLPPFEGVLFFPVTPFDQADRVDVDVLATHVSHGLDQGAGAAFVACGTGEFHALDIDEYAQAVRAGVSAAGGRHLVIAGGGGGVGRRHQNLGRVGS
ncbi:dihydrodipicolinate synthase family protein, partial [Clavibacter michiganensis]|uniref:dihydrodipicolinate synthase family protein n=1 Tax=Clavibacter michiganensis TaxID=28447 RepID=UPI00292E14F2